MDQKTYDVVICGGGLAGLTLARQLKLNYPNISLLVLEKAKFPVPVAANKVGESTVEISAFYFGDVLQMKDYYKNAHYKKLGFRYFSGVHNNCLSERPEIGLAGFLPFESFQTDRGIMENDLYTTNLYNDIPIIDDVQVTEIDISETGELHKVHYEERESKHASVAAGRWVIDAMGRRSFLQRKFKLRIPPRNKFSSVWFRVKGRFDLEDFVPEENRSWHARVPYRNRFYSTNHIVGKGYWIWLIPLASVNTSVGIVIDERYQDYMEMQDYEKSLAWFDKNEPYISEALRKCEILDFMKLRGFNYTSSQVLSGNRWACIGEAAVFSDPYYSPGSNLIAFENCIVTKLIGSDLYQGTLEESEIKRFDNFIIALNDYYSHTIHKTYAYFHQEYLLSLSYLWDLVVGWGILLPQMFHGIVLDAEKSARISAYTDKVSPLVLKISALLLEWKDLSLNSYTFSFINYGIIPFVRELYNRNVSTAKKSMDTLVEDYKKNLEDVEALATVIFILAVEDTHPEKLHLFLDPDPVAVNLSAINLDPASWKSNQLFKAGNDNPRIKEIYTQLKSLYKPVHEPAVEVANTLEDDFNVKFE